MANHEGDTKFDESIRESISALLDGEATELETRRVLANVEAEEESRAIWSRYQIASRAIRGEAQTIPSIDLSAQISARLADEATHAVVTDQPAANTAWYGGWVAQLGKGAIAASVALAAVFGVNQYNAQNPSVNGELAAVDPVVNQTETSPAANLPMGYGTPGLTVRNVSTDSSALAPRRQVSAPVQFVPRTEAPPVANPAVEEFLRQLMAEHANAGAEAQGAMPFERVPRIATESE